MFSRGVSRVPCPTISQTREAYRLVPRSADSYFDMTPQAPGPSAPSPPKVLSSCGFSNEAAESIFEATMAENAHL